MLVPIKFTASLLAVVFVCGCGGGDADNSAAPDLATTETPQASPRTADGRATFTAGTTPVSFGYRAAGNNYYLRSAASALVRASADGDAQLLVTFLAMDLRAHPIPGTFPPERSGTSPFSAMQNVGFSYMNADGTEWAGPGRIHVESFSEDGRLVATFDEVTLPHTKGIEPDLTLSNGRLETTLD